MISIYSKNVVYNYTDAEVKVRDATSNDPWGPSGTVMSEIAEYTFHVLVVFFNSYTRFPFFSLLYHNHLTFLCICLSLSLSLCMCFSLLPFPVITYLSSFPHSQAYTLVMGMLWKRLNDHGKNWRHVYKVIC